MDGMSQRYTDDQLGQQVNQQVGHITKESIESGVKLLIEGIHHIRLRQNKKVKVTFNAPQDLYNNTKDALAMGADKATMNAFMDKHKMVQSVRRQYPDQVEGLKQDVLEASKQNLMVEQQSQTPEFKQSMQQFHKEQQAQQQKQSQGQSFDA